MMKSWSYLVVVAELCGLGTLVACGNEPAAADDDSRGADDPEQRDPGADDDQSPDRDDPTTPRDPSRPDGGADAGGDATADSGTPPSTTFGTLGQGTDPCVGANPGWTTTGRCNARVNRSMVISVLQNPKVEKFELATGAGGSQWTGEVIFGANGVRHVSNRESVITLSSSGQQLWSAGGYKQPVLGPDGALYTGTSWSGYSRNDPTVKALDPATGTPRWSRNLSGRSWPQMVLPDGSVVAAGYRRDEEDSALQVLNPATGADAWVHSFGSGDINDEYDLLAASNGDIFVERGTIEAFDHATHASRWKTTLTDFTRAILDEPHGRLLTLRTNPSHTLDHELGSVDLATGTYHIVSTANLISIGELTLGSGPWVYACATKTAGDGEALYAFHTEDPSLHWDLEMPDCSNRPVVGGDGTVYVSGYDYDSASETYQAATRAVSPEGALRWRKVVVDRPQSPFYPSLAHSIDASGNLWVRFVDANLLVRFYE